MESAVAGALLLLPLLPTVSSSFLLPLFDAAAAATAALVVLVSFYASMSELRFLHWINTMNVRHVVLVVAAVVLLALTLHPAVVPAADVGVAAAPPPHLGVVVLKLKLSCSHFRRQHS